MGEKEDTEKYDYDSKKDFNSDKNLDEENNQASQKPNWFVCFFKALAAIFLSGFIGKNLLTDKKCENRFLSFIFGISALIICSLPIALFVSYFLITLSTWIFVLAVLAMVGKLGPIVQLANFHRKGNPPKQPEEELKSNEELAKNHAKFYEYGGKYYKEKPTTLIGDVFRWIGTAYFTFLTGKNFMSGIKVERLAYAKMNTMNIICIFTHWTLVVSCFLMTVPTWLFVLAIVAAASEFVNIFCSAYLTRQDFRKEIFFCKCEMKGENGWHASLEQIAEENRYDGIPECDSIDKNDVKH